MTWDEWVGRLGLRYFTAREIAATWDRPGNEAPRRELWGNIVPTLLVLDRIRELLGQPIHLNSTYRTLDYNMRVGGSPRSQHMEFSAIDFHCDDLEFASAELEMLRERLFLCPVELPERQPDTTLPSANRPEWEHLTTWHSSRDRFARNPTSVFQWQGGIGLYSTFIHVDSRGVRADW